MMPVWTDEQKAAMMMVLDAFKKFWNSAGGAERVTATALIQTFNSLVEIMNVAVDPPAAAVTETSYSGAMAAAPNAKGESDVG